MTRADDSSKLSPARFYPVFGSALISQDARLALQGRIRFARQLTPEQRVLAGIEQSEFAIQVVREGLFNQYPEADEPTRDRLLQERMTLMRSLERRLMADR